MNTVFLKLMRMVISMRNDIVNLRRLEQINGCKYLTIERAAEYTGMSERCIKDLISQREIAFCRPTPNRTFIPVSELDSFMSRNLVASHYLLECKARKKERMSRN